MLTLRFNVGFKKERKEGRKGGREEKRRKGKEERKERKKEGKEKRVLLLLFFFSVSGYLNYVLHKENPKTASVHLTVTYLVGEKKH